MMHRPSVRGLAAIVAAGLLLSLASLQVMGAPLAQQEPPRAGGQYWFGRYGCAACHGGRGEGTLIGPQIAGRPDSPLSYERILKQVRTPIALMPDFPADVLPDEKIKAIADFIATLEPGAAPMRPSVAPPAPAMPNAPLDAPFTIADPASYDMREYPLPESETSPSPTSRAHSISIGPDGRIWYSGLVQNNLGMFDPATETFGLWDTPSGRSRPHGIQAAGDGMIWLTETGIPQNKIARFNPTSEAFTEYDVPRRTPYPHTVWIARDGLVYFTYEYGDGIGRLDPASGSLSEWPIPTKRARAYGIEEDADGNVWAVEFLGNKVVRLDPQSGEVREWTHPRAADDPGTRRMAIDSLGRIWFTEHEIGAVGRFDPLSETWQSWWMPRRNGRRDQAYALAFDSKGQLWANNFGGNYLARFDTLTESWVVYPHVSQPVNCRLLAIDANDVLWCAGSATPVLVRLELR
jgi:virginiamycin B lyase